MNMLPELASAGWNSRFTLAVLFFICGVVILVTSRGAADEIAGDLQTHARREGRSRWLDPVFNRRQLVVASRTLGGTLLLLSILSAALGLME